MSDPQPGTRGPGMDGFGGDRQLSRRSAAIVILGLSVSLWSLLFVCLACI